MQIAAISRVRNEADIIEPFVRHTLAYCGKLIVIDHGSTDATGEILDQLRKEGLALHIIRDTTLGHVGVEQMNRLLKLAAGEFSADWIFCLDADEFIAGAPDASFLPFPVDDQTPCLKMRMRTYYSKPDDAAEALNPVERITRRLKVEPMESFKVIVPGPLARQPASQLVQGNHYLRTGTRKAMSEVLEDVHLAHFPLRSPSQYAVKLAAKYLQRLHKFSARSTEATFYDEAYAQVRESYSSFAKSFTLQRLAYLPPHDVDEVVADPIRYAGGPLRHTPGIVDIDEFAGQLLALMERMALSNQASPDVSEPSAHPALSIEAYAHPERDAPQVQHFEGSPAITHSAEFDLECEPGTDELRLRFDCDPGMLEISQVTLIYDGSPPEGRSYGPGELKRMLRVVCNGATIHAEHVYRLFISSEPVLLTFRDWRQGEEAPPKSLRINLRYERRNLEGVFLHPNALNAITRERTEYEGLCGQLERMRLDLLQRARYAIGSTIDFSDHGNGVFYIRNGWNESEPLGTWTAGQEAALEICFESAPDCDVWLNACVRGFVPPSNPEVRAGVRVNGELLTTWISESWEFEMFRVRIPGNSFQGAKCEVVFEIANPVSPKDAGVSEDERVLGLGFKSIDFQPVTEVDGSGDGSS